MEFGPSKAQALLRQSIVELLDQKSSVERVREVMETDDAVDQDLRVALGEQGLFGLLVDEQHGGAGLGLFESVLVAQEIGRFAAPVDYVAAAMEAPLVLEAAASAQQAVHKLRALAAGEVVYAVIPAAAFIEVAGEALRGTASFQPGVVQADRLLVCAGKRVFEVPKDAPGVTVSPLHTIDETRRWADVEFDEVPLEALEELEHGIDEQTARRVRQAVWLGTAADSLGACYRAIEIAVEYAKGREQFGRVIGSFQGVKHMCAEMIAEVDPLQSLLWYAAYAWDERLEDSATVAALAKAHSAEVGYDCVTRATQVFGGIGFTWDCDMQLYFKRVQVDRQAYGRPEEIRATAARLQT